MEVHKILSMRKHSQQRHTQQRHTQHTQEKVIDLVRSEYVMYRVVYPNMCTNK